MMKQMLAIAIYIMTCALIGGRAYAQGNGVDLYWVRSAHLADNKTIDFRLNTSRLGFSRAVNTILATGDTVRLGSSGNLTDIQWRIAYGLADHMELSFSGVTMMDKLGGASRYGMGDMKGALRFGTAKENSPINLSGELYYIFPIGFDEGTRLIRQFSAGHGNPGVNVLSTFRMSRINAHINAGYSHNGGIINRLPDRGKAYYYPVLDGTVGIGENTKVYTSSQANVGFGGDFKLFGKIWLFGEYAGRQLLAKEGDNQSLGMTSFGLSYINPGGFQAKLGYIRPSDTIQPNSGFMLEIRLNDIFGRRRAWQAPPQPKDELIPAISPGQKPFFRRDATLFAAAKMPVYDTIFLIDSSPSMMGRGLRQNRGENILADLPNFLAGVLEGISAGSNVALITYSDAVRGLTWNRITDDKKEDIRRSINDVPDEAATTVSRILQNPEASRTVENLVDGINRSYQQLEVFRRGDYNRIHLQRIIHITDDIIDDSLSTGDNTLEIEQVRRRYAVDNEDFRLYYYLLANRSAGKTVQQYMINFVEREDGAILREVDVNRRDEIIPRLNFNQKQEQPSFKYLSQLTRIAVIPFGAGGKALFSDELTRAFKNIFENNAYFKLADQNEVNRTMQITGLDQKERISVTQAQKFGRQMGVDFVVVGEIKSYRVNRDKGLYVPRIAGLPKTEIEMKVGIDMIDVASGAIAYSEIVSASEDAFRGLNLFAADRTNRTDNLSSLDSDRLRENLLSNWKKNVIDRLFQDITVMRQ